MDWTTKKWPIANLTPHALEDQFFPPLPPLQFEALLVDMQINGLRSPIIVLPDGTIVSGHQRVAAAKQLGWTEIDAIVRDDLVGDPQAVVQLFVAENLFRRQLSPIQRARCAKQLFEALLHDDYPRLDVCSHGPVRDYIGELLGVSGREVSRIVRVLKTPVEVQTAYDNGHLSLTRAGAVAGRPPETREAIAADIRAQGIGRAREIVEKHLSGGEGDDAGTATEAYAGFVRQLRRGMEKLKPDLEKIIPGPFYEKRVATLESAIPFVKALLELEARHRRRAEEDTEKAINRLKKFAARKGRRRR